VEEIKRKKARRERRLCERIKTNVLPTSCKCAESTPHGTFGSQWRGKELEIKRGKTRKYMIFCLRHASAQRAHPTESYSEWSAVALATLSAPSNYPLTYTPSAAEVISPYQALQPTPPRCHPFADRTLCDLTQSRRKMTQHRVK
jgi:hypothetical protein